MRGWEGENHKIFCFSSVFMGKSHFSFWEQLSGHKEKILGIIPKILILFKIPVRKGDLGRRVGILVPLLPPCAFPVKFPKDFPPHAQEKLFGVIFGMGGGRKGGINKLGAVAMATCC